MQPLYFFSEFIKQRQQVGSVAPSSRFLAKSICKKINFQKTRVIVELGPGTGAFTKHLLKNLKEHDYLFCIEQNQLFFEKLSCQFNDPRVTIINGSAEDVIEHLSSAGFDEVDCIVSSLPLNNIDKLVKEKILTSCHYLLKPAGQFLQYQYLLSDFSTVKRHFAKHEVGFQPINLPPAFIYNCTKSAENTA